jgi:tetratricopeptide (TPR) repeat protein
MQKTRLMKAVMLTVGAWALALVAASAQATRPSRILVMPFDTGREPRAYWLGEASAVLLADSLKALGVDAIARDERIRAFARLQVPSVATLTHGTVIRVGQLVGASSVVVGSLALDGETIAVRARSIRLDTGRLQAEVEERAKADELFGLYDRVARRLSGGGGATAGAPSANPTPLAAFENYIKGLLAETPGAQTAFLRKALDLFPAYDAAGLALWRAHTDAGQPEQALAAATAILARTPANEQALFAAACSEIQVKRYDEAYRRLRALAERGPSAPVFNNLGIIQARRGSTPETGKATYWFNRAATENRVDPDYFFNLGYAYWLDEDRPAAIYWLREALRRNPADAEAHYVIAIALRTAGSVTEADRELELARRLSATYERASPPTHAGTERAAKGLERMKMSLDEEGERIDSALVASVQRDQRELAGFHLDRGRRLYDAGNDSDALVELRRTLYLSPYHPEAHLLLGRIYLRRGRVRDAIDALKISLWSSETVAARVALAEAHLQQHEIDAARREIARALELDPKAPGASAVLERLEAQQ